MKNQNWRHTTLIGSIPCWPRMNVWSTPLRRTFPVSQERQLTFLLGKYQTFKIKTAFADAIGKVSTAAKKAFYPLPLCKEKLISSFLELIYVGKSIMVDNIPKTHSGKSIDHWLILFLFNVFQTGIVCCLIECFHCNVVLFIVFHCNHTIYSIYEYFVITYVSIIFKPYQTIFSTLEFLV